MFSHFVVTFFFGRLNVCVCSSLSSRFESSLELTAAVFALSSQLAAAKMKDNALKDTHLSFKMPPIAVQQPSSESGLRNTQSSTSSISPLAIAPKSAATLDPLADIDPLTNNLPFAARMLFALVGFALNPPKGPSFYATWYHSRLGNKVAMCLSLVAVLLSAMNGPGTLLGAHILNIWCLNLIPTSFFTLCHLARIWQAV